MELKKRQTVTMGQWRWTPLKWQAVAIDPSGKALLVCKKVVEARQFGGDWDLWENSELRQWLNGEFFENAFSPAEKERILISTVETDLYDEDWVKETEQTKDRIFILSREEYVRYLTPGARRCTCLERDGDAVYWAYEDYIKHKFTSSVYDLPEYGIECWLRGRSDDHGSPYYPIDYTGVVYSTKDVDIYDDGAPYSYYGVRPAFWLDISE